MSLYRTDAIVLGHRQLGEADKILTLFSPNKGKIHAVARGVRRPRSSLLGGTQLFCYSSFLLMKGRNLDSVSQCEIKESFYKIRGSLEPMAYGLYFAELLRVSTPMEDKNQELFRFFLKTMYCLQEWQDLELLKIIYEIKLMAIQGFSPEISHCVNCGSNPSAKMYLSPAMGGVLCPNCKGKDIKSIGITSEAIFTLKTLLFGIYEDLIELNVAANIKRQLSNILAPFISYHIDRKLKTLQFIRDVKQTKNIERLNRGDNDRNSLGFL